MTPSRHKNFIFSLVCSAAAVLLHDQIDIAVKIRMELTDKAVGFLLSFISLSIFTYYTFWVIILPFVDSNHFIHQYFLPHEYAIFIPVFAGVVLLCFLCIFIGFVKLKSKKKKA
ncbi:hypothetical protein QYF36_015490 [Acer negundo]|nr:hypothetical protein QYF36_015490 [Acer negundo]